jgi:hypothetical protein
MDLMPAVAGVQPPLIGRSEWALPHRLKRLDPFAMRAIFPLMSLCRVRGVDAPSLRDSGATAG